MDRNPKPGVALGNMGRHADDTDTPQSSSAFLAEVNQYATQQSSSSNDTISNTPTTTQKALAKAQASTSHDDRPVDTNPMSQPSIPTHSTSPGQSTTDTEMVGQGLEALGGDVRKLVQGIQKLRHLGIEDFVLPLPKIVVVGDQSTGKSSLIEGISGIKVPRDADCCTRCPLEINLSESTDSETFWTCKVSLYKKYLYEGPQGRAKKAGATRDRPLGPWQYQKEAEEFEFATVTSKEEVPSVLYWAQMATLNPGTHWKKYVPHAKMTAPETLEVKFSPNVVRLDISGPELPNLSFYDLPGVINVAEIDEERYLVGLVKNLVKEYIKSDNCVNLLALPMTDDAANSSAAGIIKEAQAERRTIGVLTKPDRVQSGESMEQWTTILNGQRFALGKGYFIVKNNPDPKVEHAQARAEEVEFFNNTEPYSTDLEKYSHRFGTHRLQAALSHELKAQILTSLPLIFQQVSMKSDAVAHHLKSLPKRPAGNLPMIVHTRIMEFTRETAHHIDGGSAQYPFQKLWYRMALGFRKSIGESRPVLVLPHSNTQMPIRSAQEADQDDGNEMPDTPTPSRVNPTHSIQIDSDEDGASKPKTPVSKSAGRKRQNREDNISSQGQRNDSASVSSPAQTPNKRARIDDIPAYSGIKDLAKRYRFEDIREFINTAYIGLPGAIDPKAIERICSQSVEHWDKIATEFLKQTFDLCAKAIHRQVESIFGPWKQTQLFNRIIDIIGSFLERAIKEQNIAMQRLARIEHEKPMTLNVEGMEEATQKAIRLIESKNKESRAAAYISRLEAQSGKQSTGQQRIERIAKVTDLQLGPDEYHQELLAIGTVRGYYEIAYTRFVDAVTQSIQVEFFSQCRNKIGDALVTELGLEAADANDKCALLLAVKPEIEETRQRLIKEQQTLLTAREWLGSLATPDTSVGSYEQEDTEMEA